MVDAPTIDPVFLLRGADLETALFHPGRMAPNIVCGSRAQVLPDGTFRGEALPSTEAAINAFAELLEGGYTLTGANLPYDLACIMQARESLKFAIFKALREARVHDVLISQSLDAIANGHLGLDPRTGGELRNGHGKTTKRYNLFNVTDLVLGRKDAKAHDVWRESYALLKGIPFERWPEEARAYLVDDAVNPLEIAIRQIVNHENQQNLPEQVEAAFALHLGACHGLRTDPERVERLAAKVDKLHAVAVERFQKKGWVRAEGTEDQAAVKRAIATAYGAEGACERCGGSGKIRNTTQVPCRGEKVRGRFQGCGMEAVVAVNGVGDVPVGSCATCGGRGTVDKIGNEVTCKASEGTARRACATFGCGTPDVREEGGKAVCRHGHENEVFATKDVYGCDGTGLDLTSAPMLPRTDKGGVGTDRDALMESGDEDLSDYGENEFEKSRSTYVPYLRTGVSRPLSYSANVLVASGRCSYEGTPLHQMPRNGDERSCIRARGAWCGSPIEYVLGSTDYEAGEMSTLAQYCFWTLGKSRMREAINASGKPGILHSDLAAEVLGIPLEEFLKRLKAKDKQAVDFRQAAKPINFGKPGLMGSVKIVLTNRKKSAGFTESEYGPAVDLDGKRGFWGIRSCILVGGKKVCGEHKIMKWKNRECPPVCKACVDVVENVLGVAYNKRYPEIKEYFKWVFDTLEQYGGRVPCLVADPESATGYKIIRWRGGVDKAAACNSGFQGMLSDIGKLAFTTMVREAYLGVKDDGSPSPLAGTRFPIFAHDEPISEIPEHMVNEAAPRIAEISMWAGYKLAPDVTWKAETAIARYWYKAMEPVKDERGNLIPWEPKVK